MGRAAAALFLTQQALSKRIARLEDEVGVLFDRGPTGVTLTPVGERFLPAARHLLQVADHTAATARDERGPPLRVDVWGRLGPLEAVARAFAVDHPQTIVEIGMRQNFHTALDALRRNEIDVAFGNVANLATPLPDQLSSALAVLIPAVGLVGEHSELAAADTIDPDALRRRGVAVPPELARQEFARFVTEYAADVGARISTESHASIMEGLVDRVASGPDTVTLVPAAWPLPDGSGYTMVPVHPVPLFPSYAVWRTATPHPLVPALLHAVRASGIGSRPTGSDHWLPAGARS